MSGPARAEKPAFAVPLVSQIRRRKWNGRTLVSTFSGCGGSCLGFRMDGFRVIWASEFIEAARESYRANARRSTELDPRDIREVKPEDIMKHAPDGVDVLEGSPPCASFSTSGKREKHWGEIRPYSETEQRTDDLFFEFARLVEGVRPKVFVAENVSGLVKGKAKGYFKEILARLKACGYAVECRMLDAQWLGVPQARQRLFFLGVRDDLGLAPVFPKPLPYRYSIQDACPWINSVLKDTGGLFSKRVFGPDEPAPTITIGVGGLNSVHFRVDADATLDGFAIGEEWDRLCQGQKSDKYQNLVRPDQGRPSPTITAIGGQPGAAAVTHPHERRKFTIGELRRICGFPDDFVLTGTYQQQWERLGRSVPPVMMRHVAETIRKEILEKCVD